MMMSVERFLTNNTFSGLLEFNITHTIQTELVHTFLSTAVITIATNPQASTHVWVIPPSTPAAGCVRPTEAVTVATLISTFVPALFSKILCCKRCYEEIRFGDL